jgi:hypothetical protein
MRDKLEELAKRLDRLHPHTSAMGDHECVMEAAAALCAMAEQKPVKLPSFIERPIRRAIETAHNPPPGSMVVGMPKALVPTDKLDYVLRQFDAGLYASPVPAVDPPLYTITKNADGTHTTTVTQEPKFDVDEAMRKDAERYRWLREHSAYVGVNPHHRTCLWTLRNVYEIPGESFDAAIDAALAAYLKGQR